MVICAALCWLMMIAHDPKAVFSKGALIWHVIFGIICFGGTCSSHRKHIEYTMSRLMCYTNSTVIADCGIVRDDGIRRSKQIEIRDLKMKGKRPEDGFLIRHSDGIVYDVEWKHIGEIKVNGYNSFNK